MRELGLSAHSNGEPTYWPTDPRRIPDLLDFAITKGIDPTTISSVGCYDLCSDHSMVKILFNTRYLSTAPATKLIKRYTNRELFKSWLEENVEPLPEIHTRVDIDEAVENLARKVHLAAHIATPTQEAGHIRVLRARRDNHLWSTELASKVAEKRRLRRVWQLSRRPSDKTAYNRASKDLKQLLLDSKSKSLEAYLANLEPGNVEHNLWNATKYLKRPIRRVAPIQTPSGTWCRTSQEKANTFAEHLRNSFQPFQLCDSSDLKVTTQFLDAACPMDLPIREIRSSEIQEEIANLKLTKSPGYDQIDASALKLLPQNCIDYLNVIMNQVFVLATSLLSGSVLKLLLF